MADAIVCMAAERMRGLIEEQARHHVNPVRGAEEMLLGLIVKLQTIRNVIDDAEKRRFNDKHINQWLSKLEWTAYELDYVLDEWSSAIRKLQISDVVAAPKQKVCSFIPSSSCLQFKKVVVRNEIVDKLLNVRDQLDVVLKEKDRYGFVISQPTVGRPSPESWRDQSTPLVDLANVHGQDVDRDILVGKLVDNSQEEFGTRVVSIVGMGGLGKTTLAQLAYNHRRVEEYFELRIWVCVSDPFDLTAIAKGILESINWRSSSNTNNLEALLGKVHESVNGKRFLLVLDDVWTEDHNKWEPLRNSLRCGRAGSRVLVTTRNVRVAKMLGSRESDICYPAVLSDDDFWLLLCRVALSGRNEVEFEEIGKKIAKKCNGLPIAAKTLGSLLRFKARLEEWEYVLNSEIWTMQVVQVDMYPVFLLSCNDLSPTLRLCFSYCAIFPRDTKIIVESLIENWMALGYLGSNIYDMELKGREYFNVLATRSLFQDFEKDEFGEIISCTMHAMLHEFCQFIRKTNRLNKSTACHSCDPLQVSNVNAFFTLFCDEKTPPDLCCECLVRLRILNFTNCGLKGIPHGIENLVHLRWLNLTGITEISSEELKIIFKLYRLQTLGLRQCGLKEIPMEIGTLIQLRRLDLSGNKSLKELPMEIGNLIHLRHLDLSGNESLEVSHESISGLRELKTFNTFGCRSVCRLYVRVNWTRLNGRSPNECQGRNDWSKLTSLENLNHLGRVLWLKIRLDGDINFKELVEDARAAELRNKTHIEELRIYVEGLSTSSVSMDVIEALQPHPNLRELSIWNYGGSKLPMWILSPVNQLRNLKLHFCNHLTSLPPLGKLPCLEEIHIDLMESLEIVGREFLGMTTGEGGAGDVVVFPKLKTLELRDCDKWTKWEDITEEEEKSAGFSVMPCLTELTITGCNGLTMLPHRLLRKASLLNKLRISGSTELVRRYGNEDDSIPINNPGLHLICYS